MTTATSAAPENSRAGAFTLQMVRAEVNVRDFQRWMGTRRLQDPDHAMHCLLTECFGGMAPKPFRLIVPRGGPTGCLYGYGQSGADALREAASICADPLQARIIPASTIDSKAMPTQWTTDKRLGFEVRIRPVVRLQKGLLIAVPDKQQSVPAGLTEWRNGMQAEARHGMRRFPIWEAIAPSRKRAE